MWPTISNIDSKIEATIKGYANDNLAASKLNAWVRVFSGANEGLILQSNTDFKLFAAAGAGNAIYGSADRSGVIGKTWGTGYVTSGVGRALRPSPIITSLNSKEGQDLISRTCEFSITCFSLEQLELIQTYFMEPGYSIGVEWGWNTPKGVISLVPSTGQSNILNAIADATINTQTLNEKRFNSNGEYDIFLGFIIGSSVSSDGENFKVDVKLRGAPALPAYLQSQNRITVKSSGVPVPEVDEKKVKAPYSPQELEAAADGEDSGKLLGQRRFKYMFNELPAFRQTENVKGLINEVTYSDFINFDAAVSKKISEFIKTNEGSFFPSVFGEPIVEVTFEGGSAEIEKEKIFSKNRYIRFGLAIDILNKIGEVDHYEIGDKKISFTIDISNSIIGAFPSMFSTKSSKLIIPGFVPNFMAAYFLNPNEVSQQSGGTLVTGGESWPPQPAPQGKGTWGLKFIGQSALAESDRKEQAFYYGRLKNLFVNFDMFKEKIEQQNKNIREIVTDILNEMSSAVNSFWNFQIVEGKSITSDIILTVIDENWVGLNPDADNIVKFKHSGVGSPFLNASLDVSIPADMANKIINDRLGNNSQPDLQNLKVGPNTFFNAKTDLFLKKRQADANTGADGTDTSDVTEDTDTPEAKNKKLAQAEEGKIEKSKNTSEYVANTGNTVQKFFDKDGKLIKTTTISQSGLVTYQYTNLTLTSAEIQAVNAEVVQETQNRITSFLDKIDVVPIPGLNSLATIEAQQLQTTIKKYFMIFCYDDTDFFDKMKNYWFEKKVGLGGGTRGLSIPLPIKYSFTILGNSGIRRGDTFNIDGIPAKYKDNGLFHVTEVEHSLSGMKWETTISGMYRQTQ
jgi:hypothetical protein